jgi:hypothetical protein
MGRVMWKEQDEVGQKVGKVRANFVVFFLM